MSRDDPTEFDASMTEVENAVRRGAWHRALRILRAAESRGAVGADPGRRRRWHQRMDRMLDRAVARRAHVLRELQGVQETQRHAKAGASTATPRSLVDRHA
ncbi:MAG: hypothetical protein GF355_01760 [Candidatus Eisenbacteria bacterium]|nr:hypothetical protein [Candidatus Eisenbacteria bacterium]